MGQAAYGFTVTNRVEVKTSMGTFVIGLYGDDAPVTVQNFLKYVSSSFYDGLIFHRVIPEFMIQGGGFDKNLNAKPTDAPIPLEIAEGIKHVPGTISMARTSDPNSATGQFFICVADQPQLDGQYAAFGMVESGYEVVEAISEVKTKRVRKSFLVWFANVPVVPVVIESIKVLP
jgi:cyclophilin family peptidyl-prolyl cis-trans isomerase